MSVGPKSAKGRNTTNHNPSVPTVQPMGNTDDLFKVVLEEAATPENQNSTGTCSSNTGPAPEDTANLEMVPLPAPLAEVSLQSPRRQEDRMVQGDRPPVYMGQRRYCHWTRGALGPLSFSRS